MKNMVKEIYKPFCPMIFQLKYSGMLKSEDIKQKLKLYSSQLKGFMRLAPVIWATGILQEIIRLPEGIRLLTSRL